MPRNTLIAYFFFILSVEFIVVFITMNLLPSKTPYLASLTIILILIISSFWMVKVLLAPLYKLSKRFDTLVKETLHELNIPIATIQANSSMLEKKLETPKQLRQLERINEASQMLHYLHKELEQTINKEFHGPQKSLQSIETFLHKRIDHYRTLYPHINFTLKVEEDIQRTLDPFGFQKAIDNLISNSAKYRSTDITLTLTHGQLTLLDNGKGISKEHLVHIFERYYQESTSQEGKGIGLAIVKSFCDQEKIRLTLQSETGSFTKVVLHF